MKLVVLGGTGMLGRDAVRAAEHANHEVAAVGGSADLDVTDGHAVRARLEQLRPDAVINCAAYTDVDGAEDDLRSVMDVNADGARNVAAGCAAVGAKLLYPSTDYVFDGTKMAPYVESDETRPQSVYGQSKLAGEHETAAAGERHFVVRTSWLFGTNGRNFVETMLALGGEHGEVIVVRDQVGCPTFTGHLAEALVRLAATEAFGVHHLAGGGECSWYEFALEIFAQSGVDCRVMSCTTDEFPRRAPRPAYSVLGTERAEALSLPHWKEGLAGYLAERAVTA